MAFMIYIFINKGKNKVPVTYYTFNVDLCLIYLYNKKSNIFK